MTSEDSSIVKRYFPSQNYIHKKIDLLELYIIVNRLGIHAQEGEKKRS